ncbi:TrmJ/YjtD family RNA methyltransferase [Rhodopseudomonas sp. P2A-2r]|uniref:TrmJ/YjtD family RNA methyltransferase n=1 Tax=Rhodopseudomonas sp. P2A-2r TaxID=2991972 RepID=UPI002234E8D9|nr:TrmJ/YjtD family RNA methyltransferase [Rhodopseudomonas sp. P2A-2r]UZE51379.1 TrmJ/YjtD family RNA methyltransferase [Rhodopseudomonas sp. P2A-2r]
MSGSGTDHTKAHSELTGPVVVLVEPQLGENIGMCARAMGNFGLTRLRLVKPRDGWPNVHARRAASGADHILDKVELFDTVEAAVADCTLLFATTARAHDQAKPVVAPEAAARETVAHVATGATAGILFGRERYGLKNEEVALANRIITFPVNPAFASLNLAQAVLLCGYEWFKLATSNALPYAMPERSEPASQHQMQAFFDNLVRELDAVEFLRPAEKRDTMLVNLRNIFTRMEPTKQDMHTLHGVVMAIAEGRKGPAKGGVLDGEQATKLRALLAEHGQGALPHESGTVRGLARLLRRNPTDAERLLWEALRTDRRFAGTFKRQTPVGRHIPDFVSFPRRFAIELVNADETEVIVQDRAARQAWLEARHYRVVAVTADDIVRDIGPVLARLETALAGGMPGEA